MPNKIILLKGLPASGKSTWARDFIKHNLNWKIVNKDSLREMLDNGVWTRGNEKFVLKVRDYIVGEALSSGFSIIVDDTNLHPKHEKRMAELASEFNAELEVKDFTNVSVSECIKRDSKRINPVGIKVIREMYTNYLMPKVKPQEYDDNKLDAVICDLDGTLAIHNGRDPYDASKCDTDLMNKNLAEILNTIYSEGKTKIIFLSGREDKWREKTIKWLDDNFSRIGIDFGYDLLMRATGDMRPDDLIKMEIYEDHIKERYNITAVFDDRGRVCSMWHSLGLPLFRVGDPNAEF